MRLELVASCLWSGDRKRVLRVLGEEDLNCPLRILWDEVQLCQGRDLCEGCLWPIMGLLLQYGDCALEGIDGLRVVLVHCTIVGLFQVADFCGSFAVAIPDRNVLVMACDLRGQHCRVSCVLLDVSLQLIDLLSCFLDIPCLLHAGVVAELLVRGELHLLRVLLRLALLHHALQKLDHLLDGSHRRAGPGQEERGAEGKLH
mmetsp:Transcript_150888/g.366486  ORF Transcript_150888/g.366486 Transcript_150888/m.366486 type:complete len:201 (-) Transcript_150888:69-671(-)